MWSIITTLLKICSFVCLFYVYGYTVAVLMGVSHHVVVGNLNSEPLLAPVSPAHSSLEIYLLLYL